MPRANRLDSALRIDPAQELGAEEKEDLSMARRVVSGSPTSMHRWTVVAVLMAAGSASGAGKEGDMGVGLAALIGEDVELEAMPAARPLAERQPVLDRLSGAGGVVQPVQ
jgi:hypothetical protein